MKKATLFMAIGAVLTTLNVNAEGYQHGWRVYERPQPGVVYTAVEANPFGPVYTYAEASPFGPVGSQFYGPGGGNSYGPGGGNSYGPGGGKSYGPGGGLNPTNPWKAVR